MFKGSFDYFIDFKKEANLRSSTLMMKISHGIILKFQSLEMAIWYK